MASPRILIIPAVGLLAQLLVACVVGHGESVAFEGRRYGLALYIDAGQAARVTVDPIGEASEVGPPWVSDRTVYRYGVVDPAKVIVLFVDAGRWDPSELGSAAPALAAFSVDLSSPEVGELLAGAMPSDRPERRAALAAAEALWSAEGPSAYRFTVTLSWLIPPDWRGPFTFHVRDGRAVEVWRAKEQLSLEDPVIERVPRTVPELFAEVRGLAGAARLDVRFDQTYGFPTEVKADVQTQAIDDEGGFVVTDFEAVDAVP